MDYYYLFWLLKLYKNIGSILKTILNRLKNELLLVLYLCIILNL